MKNKLIFTQNTTFWKLNPGEKISPRIRFFSNTTRTFTVADTRLSYRKIYLLDEDNLLPDSRLEEKGWRKFNYKELVYLTLIDEFRKYGLEKHQLKKVKSSFFGKSSKDTEEVMYRAANNQPISVVLDEQGGIRYLDSPRVDISQLRLKSYVCVNLTDIAREVIARVAN